MPIYEHACTNRECSTYGQPIEGYFRHFSAEPPACGLCGGATVRMASAFSVVFTGLISRKYLSRNIEKGDRDDGAHWAWETTADGTRRPIRIETFEQQRAFCKKEGLVNPSDIGPMEVGSDGRSISSRGMPG